MWKGSEREGREGERGGGERKRNIHVMCNYTSVISLVRLGDAISQVRRTTTVSSPLIAWLPISPCLACPYMYLILAGMYLYYEACTYTTWY